MDGFFGGHLFFKLEWREVAEGAVAAVRVVEGLDVIEDQQPGGGARGWHLACKAFGFERGDEAFGQRVVGGIARAAHAAGDARGGGELRKGIGGVMHADSPALQPPFSPPPPRRSL